ncbi:alkaline phosphatase [Aspergillus heteromorphus CBS 117.55]|uniref:Alkaline phosphatase n=1 Tax=Aspergillus heteromorphus CBS 117.55 TaxID=1448321 RepID=A0A317VZ04_9EURO|nr:alkaline phosphatase [Aspergillus heteromorphus CBS 117.55]PWY79584.1 alkaline phosphatase [Aspergillus heteromorphus CBS 117.55]
MPPVFPNPERRRVILYHQTICPDGQYVSMLPLLENKTGVTHIILAAFHLNADPQHITLNNDPPQHEMYNTLWAEVPRMKQAGVRIMGMLGGAAQGSFRSLDGDQEKFELYYQPLRDMVRRHQLDGLDLDVEEEMSLAGVIRLIDRLKADMGDGFIITLAPVAAALLGLGNLSGFSYFSLEQQRASKISWYNAQFYNGWGQAEDPRMYAAMISQGWSPNRVVYGLLTNPGNGSQGYVAPEKIGPVLAALVARYPDFGGVMGWEYFNSKPGDREKPWQWAAEMTLSMRMKDLVDIPGHHFPPLIFTLLAVYLAALVSLPRPADESSSDQPPQGVLKTLLTGLPSARLPLSTRLTVLINIALGLLALDFVVRGFLVYPSTDIAFSRVGYVSPTTANLLVREPDPAQLPLAVFYQQAEEDPSQWTEEGIIYSLDDTTDFTTTVTIRSLEPSSLYRYSLSNNQTGSFTTAPMPGSKAANRVSFLTSSCIKANFPYNPLSHPLRIPGIEKMTEAITRLPSLLRPSFMMFLGDFIYVDVPQRFGSSISHYRSEYRRVYNSPSWTQSQDNPAIDLPWIHTLDDHEIENDWSKGNTTAPYPAAAEPYIHYHVSANPPIPATPFAKPENTTYFSFINGPASFFMVDTRTYRSAPAQPDSTILGSAQLQSLLAFLSRPEPAEVRWKLIASSVPFTKNWPVGTTDTWGGFLNERQVVFDAMWRAERELGVRVVLLSGDRHEFGATRFPDPALALTADELSPNTAGEGLHEFCVGPLNMFYLPIRTYRQKDTEDVAIKYIPEGNTKFGLIDIDVQDEVIDTTKSGATITIPSSVLTYSLYIDSDLVWQYSLSVPLPGYEDKIASVAAWKHPRFPPGKLLLDTREAESWDAYARRAIGEVTDKVDWLRSQAFGLLERVSRVERLD